MERNAEIGLVAAMAKPRCSVLRISILHFSLLILTFSMILILPLHVLERNVLPVVLDVPVAALTWV